MVKFQGIEKHTTKNIRKNLDTALLDEEYIPRGSSIKYYPLAVERAEGSLVWDRDGNRYIDFLTSAAVYNIGHCHPRVVKAVKDQADKVFNYITGYFYQENPARLAKLLSEITPGNFKKKVTFGFSGSDANDSAMKAARAYTGKKYILSFKESYHGTTYGSLAITGIIDESTKKCVYPPDGVGFVEFPDPLRNSWGIDGYREPEILSEKTLQAIRSKIDELQGNVAGIIIEPIQGDCGAAIPPSGFMKDLKLLCEEKGILFISEEIQSGMGRTGKMWAIELFDVEPDIIVAGKALGGGLPISAVIGKAEVMDSVPPPLFCFTHLGHALNTGAAIETIGVTLDEDLMQKALDNGDYLKTGFDSMAQRFDLIGDIRYRGLLFGVDIVRKGTEKDPDRDTALKICWRAWEKGLIMITFGKHGNVLRIAPPLNIGQDLLDEALRIIEESIVDVLDGKVSDEAIRYLQGW